MFVYDRKCYSIINLSLANVIICHRHKCLCMTENAIHFLTTSINIHLANVICHRHKCPCMTEYLLIYCTSNKMSIYMCHRHKCLYST